MSNHSKIYLILSVFVLSLLFSNQGYGDTAKNVADALDNPEGVIFTKSDGWTRKSGTFTTIGSTKISSVGDDYLVCDAPDMDSKPKTFSLQVQGAGTLFFNYQVSLDDETDSRLAIYDNNDPDYEIFDDSDYWGSDIHECGFWGEEQEYIELYSTYTTNLTIALYGPTSEDEPTPSDWLDDDQKILKKAWLDNFVWVPDPEYKLLYFEPSPKTDGEFEEELSVSLESDYDNITFRYTLDGSTPTINSTVYDLDSPNHAEIILTKRTTIKAIALENGEPTDGVVYEATYIPQVSRPFITLQPQNDFETGGTVRFSSETPNATFYYTLNGATPVPGVNATRGSSVVLNSTATIKVIATAPDFADSEVAEMPFEKLPPPVVTYQESEIPMSTPVFENELVVNFSSTVLGGIIKYQIASEPIRAFNAGIPIQSSCVLKYQQQQAGELNSEVITVHLEKASESHSQGNFQPGWNVFAIPGKLPEISAKALAASLQPFAYHPEKKIYYRPEILKGGEGYWLFVEHPETSINVNIAPGDNVLQLPPKKWQFSLLPPNTELPESVQAFRWNGKQFQPVTEGSIQAPLWLLNTTNQTLHLGQ